MRVGKDMQFFGARANLAKALLYAINGGRDENSGAQVAPALPPLDGDVLDYDEVVARFDTMMEWLAATYVNALKWFCNWCVDSERLVASPVARIPRADENEGAAKFA